MRINNLRYNALIGSFEASVDINRDGRTFRYPCALQGPQNMDQASVTAGLAERAMRMSDTVRL